LGSSPDDVLGRIKDEDIQFVDFRFCDLPGLMQHYTLPSHQLTEDVFEDGLGFDGSSVRGFQEIQESDMMLVPDPDTAVVDPFRQHRTLILNCFVRDPLTGEPYSRDPRYVAQKAEQYLKGTGIADTAYFGPEAEFFIFDDVRFDTRGHESYYYVDSVEGDWNTGKAEGPNLGYKPRQKQGYFPVPPMDHFTDLRSEMVVQRRPGGDRHPLRQPPAHRGQDDDVQVHREEHRAPVHEVRHVHAEADLR
jgi:glutamine synthetase